MNPNTYLRAGIIGLYLVYELLEKKVDANDITIIAEHLPGDLSSTYASPYAGAYLTIFVGDESFPFARYTYQSMDKLRDFLGGDGSGIGKADTVSHFEEPIDSKFIERLRFIPHLEVGKSWVPGCSQYVKYNGFVFNPPVLTKKMIDKFQSLGVKVVRKKLSSLGDIGVANATILNCLGLGAEHLVNDPKVFSTRGQVVVVRAPHIKETTLAWTADASTYVIPRPDSNTHEVILGGFYQSGRYDPTTYGYESEDILARISKLFPHVLRENAAGNTIEDLEVLRTVAGARPTREGGVRIEREETPYGTVLHNYGACGVGYLCGLGMAAKSIGQLDLKPLHKL